MTSAPTPGRIAAIREWLGFPVAVFLLSRVLLFVIAEQAPALLGRPRHVASPSVLPRGDVLAGVWNWSSPWFHFDTRWFVGVATQGYHWGSHGSANTNFLPAFPALIRLLRPLALDSAWLSSWLVANVALLAAMTVLYRWAQLRWEAPVAVRVVLLTISFPFAFFFSAPYAESLFLALSAGAFLLAEEDRWRGAASLAAIAGVTRPVGIALIVALALMALERHKVKAAGLVCAGIFPLLAFSAYLAIRFGRPLGFLVNHSGGWVRAQGGVFNVLGAQFHTYLSPFDRVDASLAVLFLASGVLAWRRIGRGYGAYVLLGVIIPLVHGLTGMERYVIVLFPAMAIWGTCGGKGRQALLFSVSLAGLLVATVMFAVWYALA